MCHSSKHMLVNVCLMLYLCLVFLFLDVYLPSPLAGRCGEPASGAESLLPPT